MLQIAAILAFLLGTLSIITGSRVLFGSYNPEYFVLPWLVFYNTVLGVLSVLTAYSIWHGKKSAKWASALISTSHTIVLMILISAFREIVASQSIRAMLFRIIVWVIILSITTLLKPQKNEI